MPRFEAKEVEKKSSQCVPKRDALNHGLGLIVVSATAPHVRGEHAEKIQALVKANVVTYRTVREANAEEKSGGAAQMVVNQRTANSANAPHDGRRFHSAR